MTPVLSGAMEIPTPGQAYVYRAYCRVSHLLYVGLADNLFVRMAGHWRAADKDPGYWTWVAERIEWDVYASRAAAEIAEMRLIGKLNPPHNVIYTNRDSKTHCSCGTHSYRAFCPTGSAYDASI